ncbi:MAG: 4Fe-4S binding protein [Flavonifractor plautii]
MQGLQDVHADRMSAISWKDKKAVIDPTQCVGCGVCEQLCKFDAFLHC